MGGSAPSIGISVVPTTLLNSPAGMVRAAPIPRASQSSAPESRSREPASTSAPLGSIEPL